MGGIRKWLGGLALPRLMLLLFLLAAAPVGFACDWDSPDDGENDECPYAPPDIAKSNGGPGADTNRPCGMFCGDPIDFTTGNVYEAEVDYAGAGPFPLRLARHYNSLSTLGGGAFGARWSHQFGGRLEAGPSVVKAIRPDGRAITFTYQPKDGTWAADSDVNASLARLATDTGVALWQYRAGGDEVETYSAGGRLLSVANRAGLAQTFRYDAQGRLAKAADPFGRTLGFEYDARNRIVKATDPAGGVYAYAYDANNNLVSATYPDGASRQYRYEDARLPHALTGLIDENGDRLSTWRYDAPSGVAVSSERAGGVDKTVFALGEVLYQKQIVNNTPTVIPVARVARFTDALGHPWNYVLTTINGLGRPYSASLPPYAADPGAAPDEPTAYWEYDNRGNVTKHTDPKGFSTIYGYDRRNREISRTEAWGTGQARHTATRWHDYFYNLPLRITEPGGRYTDFTYDTKTGNLATLTVSATTDGTLQTRKWRYAYDDSSQQATLIDGPRTDADDLTQFGYDAQGNLASLTDALGHTTHITAHDAHGRPLTIRDPNGLATRLAYDPRGRLASRSIGGEKTAYAYDAAGQLTKITHPDGSFIALVYDAAHRLTQVKDSLGGKIVYTLDDAGNRLKERIYDPDGTLVRLISRTFGQGSKVGLDMIHRPALMTGGQGQTTRFAYDSNGNLAQTTDPLANITQYGYDALDRLAGATDPLNHQTGYAYDATDNLVKVTDPRGLATQYVHDGLGNLVKIVSPDRGITANEFDAAGNLTASTDARGRKTLYAYDALNRLASQTFADGKAVNFSYDGGTNGIGRLTGMSDPTGNTAWTYDRHGRPLQKTQTVGAATLALAYAYDDAGRLSQVTYPSGKILSIAYDAAGRPKQLAVDNQILLDNIQYTAFGAAKSWTWGNGQAYGRRFDLDGRVVQYPLGGGRAATLAYDAAGRVAALGDTHSNQPWRFGYDAASRLTGAARADYAASYAYDKNGNRTQLTESGQATHYAYAAGSNRLASVQRPAALGDPAAHPAYDAAGNTKSDGGSFTYAYDARGRLAQAAPANPDGPLPDGTLLKVQFGVNGLGQRVSKTATAVPDTATTTLFAYDEAGRLAGEYGPGGGPVREAVWLGNLPVAVLAKGAAYYVYADHLGAPRAAADAAGAVVWRWGGGPFGGGKPQADPDGDGAAFTYNLRLPGQYYDKETGLHHNGFRDYDPVLGRYLQSDPVGLAGGVNTYAYAGNDPVNAVDPLGLDEFRLYAYGQGFRVSGQPLEGGAIVGGPLDPAKLAEYGVQIGAALGAGELAAARYLAGVSRACPPVARGISNSVPSELARIIPGRGNFPTLGPPTRPDVFVTAAEDIAGLNAKQIAQRLTINEAETFTVIRFPTPQSGLASPVNRLDPGFIGGGRTAGGAREFVIPNGPIPAGARIEVVRP